MELFGKIKNTDFKELLKGGFISLFFKVLGAVSSVLFTWLITRWYGAEEYGVFITFWSILMVTSVIAKLGFDSSIIKYIANLISKKDKEIVVKTYRFIYLSVLTISIIVSVLMLIFSHNISFVFFEKDNSFLIIIVGVFLIPYALMSINAETMKGLKNITAFSVFQNGNIYILTLIFLAVYKIYYDVLFAQEILYSLAIAIVVFFILSHIVVYFNFKKNKLFFHNKTTTLIRKRNIFKVTIPMFLSNSLYMFMSWTDTIMLSGFSTEKASVGIYNTSLKIAAIGTTILVALNNIAMPKYAELINNKDKTLLKKFVKRTTGLIFLTTLPFFVIIYLFPEFLLNLFGDEFTSGKTALIILNTSFLFIVFSGTTIQLLNMTGLEKIARNILILSVIFNVILNYILIPIYDINGAAIATTSTTLLWNIVAVFFIKKKLGFTSYPNFNEIFSFLKRS
jgi:O-antigen/teichoic acid export membrane protein